MIKFYGIWNTSGLGGTINDLAGALGSYIEYAMSVFPRPNPDLKPPLLIKLF